MQVLVAIFRERWMNYPSYLICDNGSYERNAKAEEKPGPACYR